MKNTTKPKISKKLGQYVAMATAIAGIGEANGQISYTDIEPDFVGGTSSTYLLDLDDDGNSEFVIAGSTAPAVSIAPFSAGITGDSFLGELTGPLSLVYPFASNSGAVISSGRTTWFGGSNAGTLNYSSCYAGIGNSNWCGVTDKYLGLRFQISGNTHYGWALMDVSASGDSFTIKAYAYNTTPGAPITAGQQTLSVEEEKFNDVRIVALNKSIGIYNLNETTDYNLYALTGQSVLKGSINDRSYTIEANMLETGIYILELRDRQTNAVIRKKVIL